MTTRLSEAHRSNQLRIRAATLRGLLAVWRNVRVEDLAETIVPFTEAAVPIIESGHRRSAETAARYYQALRRALQVGGITRLADLPLPDPPDEQRTQGLLRGAGLSGIVNGRRRGMTPEAALRNGFVKASGSASGLVLDGGRRLVQETAFVDPAATGRWRRVTGSRSCDFCRMLAGRGAVYSDETASFSSHSHCGCSAEPEFNS